MDKDKEWLINRVSLCRSKVDEGEVRLKRTLSDLRFWRAQLKFAEDEFYGEDHLDLFKCQTRR